MLAACNGRGSYAGPKPLSEVVPDWPAPEPCFTELDLTALDGLTAVEIAEAGLTDLVAATDLEGDR